MRASLPHSKPYYLRKIAMLSYQHAYHAGCQADVQKHGALAVLLEYLTQDNAPIHYIETHAGRGLYDLSSKEALKTGEAALGIKTTLANGWLPKAHPYGQVLGGMRMVFGADAYPGSPMIARALLRDQDTMVLAELHPQEYNALRDAVHGDGIKAIKADGYEVAISHIPKASLSRGVVLIDPSYELKGDYEQAAEFALNLHMAWPRATILLWYPVLEPARHTEMCRKLRVANLPGFWHQEMHFPKDTVKRAIGTGLMAINLPAAVHADFAALAGFINGTVVAR